MSFRVPLKHVFAWVALVPATGLVTAVGRAQDLRLWKRPASPEDVCEVRTEGNLPYVQGKCHTRQVLDLYIPKGRTRFPVVVLVHGGAWTIGDKRLYGLYSGVGEFLASQGIAAVMPNYRLSPRVKHPEHVRDVAKAIAWTRNHIAEYGGDPEQLFLAGHSAGAHLVSLLALDEQYLEAEALRPSDLRGVIGVSGVYRIAEGGVRVVFGGGQPESFRIDELLPLRAPDGKLGVPRPTGLRLPFAIDPFRGMFPLGASEREQASPITHVKPGLPPFLLIAAERDLPTLRPMGEEFAYALLRQGCDARFESIPERNHNSVMFRAVTPDDPVAMRITTFIRQHADSE